MTSALDECEVESIELLIAVDEALTAISLATGKPADIIVVVPPGELPEGCTDTLLTNRSGKCLVVAGYSAGVNGPGTCLDGALGGVEC